MLLAELAKVSAALAATRSRLKKTRELAALLRKLPPSEIAIAVAYLTGALPQGKIGLGYAIVKAARTAPTVDAVLAVSAVHGTLSAIANVKGAGSQAARTRLLSGLFGQATQEEQVFLEHLILGEMRQGALDGVMAEAIAEASDLAPDAVRRAIMLSGDLAGVADKALQQGQTGLDSFSFELFRPIKPMLAQPAEAVGEALDQMGQSAFEYKLDGARVQIHKLDDQVRVFTRHLNEVTDSVPELVEVVSGLSARSIVLDGEAIALSADGRPLPFQVTMRRFGRRQQVADMRKKIPLSVSCFDCLYLDGQDLIDRPDHERIRALHETVSEALRVPRLVTADIAAAEGFLKQAMATGHEGIMAKSLGAGYQAGNRGADWLKIKPAHTLDLVVIAAEWGSGRRVGKLSNLHLGARDPESNSFVMLGKTFKGLTDAMLNWQTEQLLQREIGREDHIVHVRPELVVEIAFNELQRSRQYPAGMALRFARVKRYRDDKPASEADTIQTVRKIFAAQYGGESA